MREAQRRGQIAQSVEAEQLAFEIDSLLLGANAGFVLFADSSALQRAQTGIRDRLRLAGGSRPFSGERELTPGGG